MKAVYVTQIVVLVGILFIYYIYVASWVPSFDWETPTSVEREDDASLDWNDDTDKREVKRIVYEREKKERFKKRKGDLVEDEELHVNSKLLDKEGRQRNQVADTREIDRLFQQIEAWNHTSNLKVLNLIRRLEVLKKRLRRSERGEKNEEENDDEQETEENERENEEEEEGEGVGKIKLRVEKITSESDSKSKGKKSYHHDHNNHNSHLDNKEDFYINHNMHNTDHNTHNTAVEGDIAFVTAPDSNELYLRRALWLVRSLRLCGGSLSQAPFYLCLHSSPPHEFRREFERWNATIAMVPLNKANYKKCKPSQKLRFTQVKDLYKFNHVVLLDDDTLILQDPREGLIGKKFNATDTLTQRRGEFAAKSLRGVEGVMNMDLMPLFDEFGLRPPTRYINSGKWRPYPYLNAGLLVFPSKVLKRVAPYWLEYTNRIVQLKGKYESIRLGWFCEQVSLLISLNAVGQRLEDLRIQRGDEEESEDDFIPVTFVDDDKINFAWKRLMTIDTKSLSTVDRLSALSPAIIHYHKHILPGGLLKVPAVRKGNVSWLIHTYNSKVMQSLDGKQRNEINSALIEQEKQQEQQMSEEEEEREEWEEEKERSREKEEREKRYEEEEERNVKW